MASPILRRCHGLFRPWGLLLLLGLALPAWPFAEAPTTVRTKPPTVGAPTTAPVKLPAAGVPSLEALVREFEQIEANAASLTPASPEVTRLRDLIQGLARANAQLAREVGQLRAAMAAIAKAAPASGASPSRTSADRGSAGVRSPAGAATRGRTAGSPPGAAPSSPAAGTPAGAFFAKRGLKKFHRSGCHFGERVRADSRVYFKSPAEAAAAGLEPCKVCRPGE